MNLDEIKRKFRHRAALDIKDLDLALAAAPVLIAEVDRLEAELADVHKRLAHYEKMARHRPPLSQKGQRDGAAWEMRVDEEKNRLYIRLNGMFDYRTAKAASFQVIQMLPNLRKDFDLISDISGMDASVGQKVLFHLRKVTYHLQRLGIQRIVHVARQDAPTLYRIFEGEGEKAARMSHRVNSFAEAVGILDNAAYIKG
jgi:hypothetical protein